MLFRAGIRKCLNSFGYDVRKIQNSSDLELYQRIYDRKIVEDRLFFNIGAGKFSHPAWTNVDHHSDWYKDSQGTTVRIDWDLLSITPLPVASDSSPVVYTSHVVEHITNGAALNLFREAYRILQDKGIFRVTTPNINLDYRAYQNQDKDYFYWAEMYSKPEMYRRIMLKSPLNEASIQQLFLWSFASSATVLHADGSPERIDDDELDRLIYDMTLDQALDHCTSKCSLEIQKKYPGNHINWWNAEKLITMLREIGFSEVYLSAYGQSACPVLRNTQYFDNTHPKRSLYVEARK